MNFDKLGLGIVGIGSALMGGWHLTLQILLILMFVDIITGVLKGWYSCNFTSKQFRQGLVSKAGFIGVLILCYQMDLLMGNAEPVIRTVCATFYIAIEGTSIIENLGAIGVPIPKFIAERLAKLKNSTDGKEIPEEETKIEK